jgi:hypothetical protein
VKDGFHWVHFEKPMEAAQLTLEFITTHLNRIEPTHTQIIDYWNLPGRGPNTPRTLAERTAPTEFNTWYVHGLCHRLVAEAVNEVEVYRAGPAYAPSVECFNLIDGRVFTVDQIHAGHRITYHAEPIDPTAMQVPVHARCLHSIRRHLLLPEVPEGAPIRGCSFVLVLFESFGDWDSGRMTGRWPIELIWLVFVCLFLGMGIREWRKAKRGLNIPVVDLGFSDLNAAHEGLRESIIEADRTSHRIAGTAYLLAGLVAVFSLALSFQ